MSKHLESAVRAFQLYCGADGHTSMKVQQRLYKRAMAAAERIAKAKNMALTDVSEQLAKEAKRRGCIRPMVAKDF